MKNGIKKLPWNPANLTQRGVMTGRKNAGKARNRLACLLLIIGAANLYYPSASGVENFELRLVKERPVEVVTLRQAGKNDRDGGEIISDKRVHAKTNSFVKLLREELNAAAPGKETPKEINGGGNRDSVLAELNTNIDKLCHILLAYFIPAVIFLTGTPVLLFFWVRSMIKVDRSTQKFFDNIIRHNEKFNKIL